MIYFKPEVSVVDALEVDQTNVQNHEADPDQINDDLNRQGNLDHDPDQSKYNAYAT